MFLVTLAKMNKVSRCSKETNETVSYRGVVKEDADLERRAAVNLDLLILPHPVAHRVERDSQGALQMQVEHTPLGLVFLCFPFTDPLK